MMKAAGIIVEYNPFHDGHIHHIKKVKEITQCDCLIAVMSSNFTQRGEVAIINKQERVKAALNAGINLIIELPFLFAVESADYFARSSVQLLNHLGINDLVFGSESGSTNEFKEKYKNVTYSPPRMDDLIQDFLDQGESYPSAKSKASKEINDYYLETPNDILGVCYYRIILENHFPITIHTIPRTNDYHDSKKNQMYQSASTIRANLKKHMNEDLQTPMKEILTNSKLHDDNDYFPLLKYKLLTSTFEEIRKIHLISEGIEYLLVKNIKKVNSMEELISACTSKRYSGARIKRILTHILMNTSAEEAKTYLSHEPPYLRILGLDEIGQTYLSFNRKKITLPIVSRFEGKKYPLLNMEKKVSDVYYSIYEHPSKLMELEICNFPIRKEKI